jgi:hypothetical protein
MLLQVPPDREPADPGKRPVRQRGIRVPRLELDTVPERQDLVGEVEANPLEPGDRSEARMAEHEGAARGCDRLILRDVPAMRRRHELG